MIAEFKISKHHTQLEVDTRPHPVAGNLQLTNIRINTGNLDETYGLDQDERKALIAFLSSIPDDQP